MYLSEWGAAVAEARRGQDAYPEQRWPHEYEAVALALSSETEGARRALAQAGERGGEPSAMAAAASAYVSGALGRTGEARSALSDAGDVLTWEYAPLGVLYLTGLAYRELGETEESDALFQRAIDRWPKHPWCVKMKEMMEDAAEG